MRKLKLEIEDLAVESFATGAGDDRTGTVRGQASGREEHFPGFGHGEEGGIAGITGTCLCSLTCPGVNTCAATCRC